MTCLIIFSILAYSVNSKLNLSNLSAGHSDLSGRKVQ